MGRRLLFPGKYWKACESGEQAGWQTAIGNRPAGHSLAGGCGPILGKTEAPVPLPRNLLPKLDLHPKPQFGPLGKLTCLDGDGSLKIKFCSIPR
jgi:hypothetical protein